MYGNLQLTKTDRLLVASNSVEATHGCRVLSRGNDHVHG